MSMTKKERVIAAIEQKEVDGVPSLYSIHFLDPVTKARQLGEASIQAHLKYFEESDADVIKVMYEYRAPKTDVIRTPEDYNRLIPQDFRHLEYLKKNMELAKAVFERADKDSFAVATEYGVWSSSYIPLLEMGKGYTMEEACMLMATLLRWDEKPVLEAMQRITDGLCDLATAFIKEAKADAVYYAATSGNRKWLTTEEHLKWIKPFDLQVMKAIKDAGGYVILHICQNDVDMARFDEDYAALADAVNWGVYDVPMSLEEGREHFKGKTIIGGMPNHKGALVDGPEEAVREAVRGVIEGFGRKGLIMGADCTLSSDQDMDLLRAAVHEARSL